MRILQSLALKVWATFSQLTVPYARIEVEEHSPAYLKLDVNTKPIEARSADRLVTAYGRPIAHFDKIREIEVKYCRNGKRLEWWIVALRLIDNRSIRIGKTADGTQASIAAAHLSTITGKRVHSSKSWVRV